MKRLIKKLITLLKNIYFNIFIFSFIKKELNNRKEFIDENHKVKLNLLIPNLILEDDRYCYQKKYFDFTKYIDKNDKVLDIGSGGYPFPFATHLADLYEKKTSHRTESLIKDNRPFINCDINNLPFKDKEFDFVYCSHVLEHVDDPARACKEIMRVGKKGYIETPTKTSDIMLNFTKLKNHHKWYIEILGNTIIFMEWKDCEKRNLGDDYFFQEIVSKWENRFHNFFDKNRDMFANMFMWNNDFKYLILNKDGEILNSSLIIL